jgi:hypothetical protein
MVREGAPTTSLLVPAKDVDADLRRHDGKRGRKVGLNDRWHYVTRAAPQREADIAAMRATFAFDYGPAMASIPPMYGRNSSGTTIDPSAC